MSYHHSTAFVLAVCFGQDLWWCNKGATIWALIFSTPRSPFSLTHDVNPQLARLYLWWCQWLFRQLFDNQVWLDSRPESYVAAIKDVDMSVFMAALVAEVVAVDKAFVAMINTRTLMDNNDWMVASVVVLFILSKAIANGVNACSILKSAIIRTHNIKDVVAFNNNNSQHVLLIMLISTILHNNNCEVLIYQQLVCHSS